MVGAISLAAIFVFAANARGQSPAGALSTTPEYRELKDEMGRTVRVPLSVKRVVSLAPSVTETIYALGLQDMLVGDTDYCDYPPDAQKKTKVGGGLNPSIEQIVALKPDLVLMTENFNRPETANALSDLKIPSYATAPKNVDEIVSSTEKLAAVLGASESGAELSADLRRKLTELHRRLEGVTPRRVLFVVWTEPLISIGRRTFIADALLHAGAVSIVDVEEGWPQTSLEEVVRLQPEYLVFAESHSDAAQANFEKLAARPGWSGLEAIRNHRFAVISDAVNRPAPRIVSAIEELAHQLHPEAFVEQPDKEKAKDKSDKENSLDPRASVGIKSPFHSTLSFQETACSL
jgi:iron complex transport system substrate-binding protein